MVLVSGFVEYLTEPLDLIEDDQIRIDVSQGDSLHLAAEAGFRTAVAERDAPFGDAGPSTFKG